MKIARVVDSVSHLGWDQSPKQGKKDDREKNEKSEGPSYDEVQADAESQAGSGPGLRIVQKPVIREISGEDFVKLREALAKTASLRGKNH